MIRRGRKKIKEDKRIDDIMNGASLLSIRVRGRKYCGPGDPVQLQKPHDQQMGLRKIP